MSQNGSGPELRSAADAGGPEPAFNAPWPALLLTVGLVALYAWQASVPDQVALAYRLGLIPVDPAPRAFMSHIFVHGGWGHVLVNALGALAFGSGVCRLFGTRALGAAAFFVFFLVCALLGGLGYVLVKPDSVVPVIGASGGVSGLMGAASRVLDRRFAVRRDGGRLASFTSPTVVSMALAVLILNLMFAVLGFAPGMGEGAIAWEAHLVGYAAGLLLIGPAAWLLGRSAGPPARGGAREFH